MRKYFARLFYRKIPETIDRDYNKILDDHSSYYKCLIPELQQSFRLRLFQLLNVLSFHSVEMPITREMRAVIGGSIIEITFGLKNFIPLRFTTIVVKPYRYMYPGYGEPFLGHIDYDTSTLFFSWDDVKSGYRNPDDAINVALHEMAHVMEAENKFAHIFDAFFRDLEWNTWAQVAFQKMHLIRRGENRFLKSYGGINMKEMFAVCIETFFEQPVEFKQRLPEIYETLVRLLGQDPTNSSNPLDINLS